MAEFSYEQFVEVHEPQLRTSGVPEVFWPSLAEKLKNEIFDAGKTFQVIVEEQDDGTSNYSVISLNELKVDGPENIFLIDHAWTFRPNNAKATLREVPGFKERLMDSFGIKAEDFDDGNSCSDYIGSESGDTHPNAHTSGDGDDSDKASTKSSEDAMEEKIIDAIMKKVWEYAQTYTVRRVKTVLDEGDSPVWYLPDEFGMRLGHSNDPNVRTFPFFYGFTGQAFSLMIPIKDINSEEEVTRNYVANAVLHQHPEWYNVLLHPWVNVDLSEQKVGRSVKDDEFFKSGRHEDHLVEASQKGPSKDSAGLLDTVKVYATDDQLLKHLSTVEVEFVDKMEEADVIWVREHFHDFKQLNEKNDKVLVNQFPFESNLTVKDLFAATIESDPEFEKSFNEKTLEYGPKWYQTTFNLNNELPAFVSYFQKRAKKNLDNTWILKPWNLARGLDTTVTDNLNHIIRAVETGPKLASKYIEDPVLFRRPDNGALVKFDLRYIVFARGLDPLEILVYKDFWPRCAVNEYDLADLSDNFSHLSVHNYTDKTKVLNIRCQDFVDQLTKLNAHINWEQTQKEIDDVIREVFKTVSKNKPPKGVAPNLQSRAMYGFDIMLKWSDREHKSVEPVFLEANFLPDCERACQFYPDFADTVFQTLFLGGASNRVYSL